MMPRNSIIWQCSLVDQSNQSAHTRAYFDSTWRPTFARSGKIWNHRFSVTPTVISNKIANIRTSQHSLDLYDRLRLVKKLVERLLRYYSGFQYRLLTTRANFEAPFFVGNTFIHVRAERDSYFYSSVVKFEASVPRTHRTRICLMTMKYLLFSFSFFFHFFIYLFFFNFTLQL